MSAWKWKLTTLLFLFALVLVTFGYPKQEGGLAQRGGGRGAFGGARDTQTTSPAVGMGIIEGIVQRGDTNVPLSEVSVTLRTPPRNGGAMGVSKTSTDGTGHFEFRNIAITEYSIIAEREGFFSGAVIGKPENYASGQLTNSLPGVRLTLSLVAAVTIHGRVIDNKGQVVSNLQIDALQKEYTNGISTLVSKQNAATDDRGEYRIFGLPPGKYYLRAMPRTANRGSQPSQQNATTYFNGAPDSTAAEQMVLSPGSDTVADILLLPAFPVRISGDIHIPNETRTGNARFWLVPRNGGLTDALETVSLTSQNSGSSPFVIEAHRPGSYELFYSLQVRIPNAATPAESIGPFYFGRVTLEVGSSEITGLIINATKASSLEVRFNTTEDSSLSPPALPIQLALIPSDRYLPTTLNPQQPRGFVNPTGGGTGQPGQVRTFTQAIEGEYTLRVSNAVSIGYGDRYVSDMRQGAKSILDNGIIQVKAGSSDPVEIILKKGGGSIRGIVQDAKGKLVQGAIVILIPEGSRRKNSLLYRRSEPTGADGGFDLRFLTPGSYKVFAWERDPKGAEMDPDFIYAFEQYGRIINITDSSATTNVIVPLILSR